MTQVIRVRYSQLLVGPRNSTDRRKVASVREVYCISATRPTEMEENTCISPQNFGDTSLYFADPIDSCERGVDGRRLKRVYLFAVSKHIKFKI